MKNFAKTTLLLALLGTTQAFATTPVPQPAPQAQQQAQQQLAVGVGLGGSGTASSAATNAASGTASSTSGGGHASARGGDASNSLSLRMDAQLRDPVATATAPALAVANGTCMGSTSAGVQSVGLGISVGGTWVDKGCDTRYDAMLLVTMGLDRVATQRLCQKPEIERAMKDAGMPCQAPVERRGEAVAQPQHTDPIVRQRLGLPPL